MEHLDFKDRLILSNQFRILAAVDPSNADSYEEKAEIVENGFTIAYEWMAPHIVVEPVSEETCREVMDILNMYRAICACAPKSDASRVQFQGFDGNNEGDHFAFAHFLMFRQGKWPELVGKRDDINSHCEMLPRYRSMLERWRAQPDPYSLKWEVARTILGE